MNEFPAVRATAIHDLQQRRQRCRPGSYEERIADHAIDLALSEDRAVTDPRHLVRDARRNAASSVSRSLQREAAALSRYRTVRLHVVRTSDGSDLVSRESVEDAVLSGYSDLCAHALACATALGPYGPAFVRRLMRGDTIAEAAAAVGVSRATGNRAAKSLRIKLSDAYARDLAA